MMTWKKTEGRRIPVKSILGTLTAAAVALGPYVSKQEAANNYAYRDEIGRPAICQDHTKNVLMTDIVSDAQCQKFLEEDLMEAMTYVIRYSPKIVDHKRVLKVAGEFTKEAGPEAYRLSPMVAHFNKGDWAAGCQSFVGYHVKHTYSIRKRRYDCAQRNDGLWLCEVPALVVKRKRQSNMCLSQLRG